MATVLVGVSSWRLEMYDDLYFDICTPSGDVQTYMAATVAARKYMIETSIDVCMTYIHAHTPTK